jgi:hypothetical protein
MADELWTDLITPAELTGYARESQYAYEQRQGGTLARFLPNTHVNDIQARFDVGRAGLLPVAPFRSYDAETPLGKLQGKQRVIIELPPIGEKLRVSEYDQLRMRGGNMQNTQILNSVLDITTQIVTDVSERLEVARGQAIEFAILDIDENGFVNSADWERDPSMEVSAAVPWSDVANATPILDMTNWMEDYRTLNGQFPGVQLMSRVTAANLARTDEFRNLYATLVGRPSVVNRTAVNEVLASHDLPPIDIYDRQANYETAPGSKVYEVQPILSPNKVFYLPAAVGADSGANNGLGATYWGTTLEADEPEYGLEPAEQPGIVAATWKTRDPIGIWVHCNAIGLPVLGDANLAMVATVLPDGS